jgi:hypothetical protein
MKERSAMIEFLCPLVIKENCKQNYINSDTEATKT